MSGEQVSYSVDPLTATDPVPPEWVQKFKSLRLEALRLYPTSFLSTLGREEMFTNGEWSKRILHPKHHHLICHTPRLPATDTTLDEVITTQGWEGNDDWVGMCSLLGPFGQDQYGATPLLDRTALGSDQEETRWHMTALYVQPNHRCGDSVIAFHEAILTYLRIWTDERLETVDHAAGLGKPKRARVAFQLHGENDPLKGLYEAVAAKCVGWADGLLARRIAGMEDNPEDEPMGEVRLRVMERIIEC
ncbi:MAG: hypothetical protein Q9198_000125 [Flavoplaca austrocitrina]